MVDLPDKTDLTSSATTEADFQSAIGQLYDYLEQIAYAGPAEALTISSGVVVPTMSVVQVDTEAAAATDNLDLLTPTTIGQKVILLRSTSAARVVTLRHNQSGTGKLWLNGAANAVLYDPTYFIALLWNDVDSRWDEVYRNFGFYLTQAVEKTAHRTLLGLGTAATLDYGTSSGQVPRNSDLGTAAYVNTGTGSTQVPTNASLGTAAYLAVGVAANNIPQLDSSSRLPAVNGSLLTGLTKSQITDLLSSSNIEKTADNTATLLDFLPADGIDFTTYLGYEIEINGLSLTTVGSSLALQLTDDETPTWDNPTFRRGTTCDAGTSSTNETSLTILLEGMTGSYYASGNIKIIQPSTSRPPTCKYEFFYNKSGSGTGTLHYVTGMLYFPYTVPVKGVRFKTTSGNIFGGKFIARPILR